MMKSGALKIVIGSAFFALIPVGVKLAGELALAPLLFGRLSIAAFSTFIVDNNKKTLFQLSFKNHLRLVIWALMMLGAMLAYFQAIRWCGVAISAALLGTQPLLIALLAFLILKEKLSLKQILLVFLSAIGIFIMNDFGTTNTHVFYGAILALLSALLLSSIFIFQKKLLTNIPSNRLVFFQCLYQLPWLIPFLLVNPITFNISSMSSFLMLGIICTALAYSLIYSGAKTVETYKIGILQSIEYVLPVFIGSICYQEQLTPKTWIGIVLILLSCILVELKPKKT